MDSPAAVPLASVFTAFSTQHQLQQALHDRFRLIAAATASVPINSHELALRPEDGSGHFQTEGWFRALTLKTQLWAEVAANNPGRLILCSDNDITLLPGWVQALTETFLSAGKSLDLCFQREGGTDPFFNDFPYNSGFFLMNGSARVANFWREVSRRTAIERPFAGDQTIVNGLLHRRPPNGGPVGCAAPSETGGVEIRHTHFPPHLVVGGPAPHEAPRDGNQRAEGSQPDSAAARNAANVVLHEARAHHATASGDSTGKLRALEAFLDAWLRFRNATREDYGLPRSVVDAVAP